MLVLGIETSCDETAAAIVRDGNEILSNVIYSQVKTHTPYGGVVPEFASREHLLKIRPIVDQAFSDAGLTLDDIDGIAATSGPGLIGSLLVGLTYAKALSFSKQKPLAAVNHIEGHIYSVSFEHRDVEFPALALVVSGGHTNLFWVESESGDFRHLKYTLVGKTRDDAAGEAYDKVAKLLGLSYPGGPIIDRLAKLGDRDGISIFDSEDFGSFARLQFQRHQNGRSSDGEGKRSVEGRSGTSGSVCQLSGSRGQYAVVHNAESCPASAPALHHAVGRRCGEQPVT